MQECCTGKRDLIHISLSHSELIYFNNKAQLRANLYSSLTLALAPPPPSEGVTGLKELAFLRDLAEQNSIKYERGVDRERDWDHSSSSALPVVKGSMMVLNQLSNLEISVGRFYINLPNRMIDLARFSLPYADPMGDGRTWCCPRGMNN